MRLWDVERHAARRGPRLKGTRWVGSSSPLDNLADRCYGAKGRAGPYQMSAALAKGAEEWSSQFEKISLVEKVGLAVYNVATPA